MRAGRVVGVVVVVLGVVVTAVVAAGRLLPSSTRFPRLRQLAQLSFPPDDLHAPLVEAPADLSRVGTAAELELEFEHRYPGAHEVALDVPEPAPIASIWPGFDQLTIAVRCTDSAGHEVGGQARSATPYWRSGGWGISLVTYSVPDQLAYRGRVRCRVAPVSGGAAFARAFPRHRFVVRKASEK